jgi:hypothetical protein
MMTAMLLTINFIPGIKQLLFIGHLDLRNLLNGFYNQSTSHVSIDDLTLPTSTLFTESNAITPFVSSLITHESCLIVGKDLLDPDAEHARKVPPKLRDHVNSTDRDLVLEVIAQEFSNFSDSRTFHVCEIRSSGGLFPAYSSSTRKGRQREDGNTRHVGSCGAIYSEKGNSTTPSLLQVTMLLTAFSCHSQHPQLQQ